MKKTLRRVIGLLLAALLLLPAAGAFGIAVSVPVAPASAPFSTAPMISAGGSHILALRYDGTVWAWGGSSHGQLGNGTYCSCYPWRCAICVYEMTPVQVLGGETGNEFLENIVAISAGSAHSLALRSDGTVWAWGDNWSNPLGIGASCVCFAGSTCGNQFRSVPVQVRGSDNDFLQDIIAISAGFSHSIALSADGSVWAWGNNQLGALGDNGNTIVTSSIPIRVHAGAAGGIFLENIIAISAGRGTSYALSSNRTVLGWGDGLRGSFEGPQNRSTPAFLRSDEHYTGVMQNVSSVSAGSNHSMALRTDGTVWAWGADFGGALGTGIFRCSSCVLIPCIHFFRSIPVQVQGGATNDTHLQDVIAITAGTSYSLALRSDRTVWSWGSGALGINSDLPQGTPVQVHGGATNDPFLQNIIAITATTNHSTSYALREDYTVWAWGDNYLGLIGDGTTTNRLIPVQVHGGATGEDFLRLRPSASSNVGPQQGRLLPGIAGTVTFRIYTYGIADGAHYVTVSNLPPGITVQNPLTITDNSGTLTLTGSTPEDATIMLTLTINGITSRPFALTVTDIEFPQGISTASEFDSLVRRFPSGQFYLTDDIDLSDFNPWVPPNFNGTFDGGFNIITSVNVCRNAPNPGLFGLNSGTISNLGVQYTSHFNSVAGTNNGAIENAHTEFHATAPLTLTAIPSNGRIVGDIVLVDFTAHSNQINRTVNIADTVDMVIFSGRDVLYEGLSVVVEGNTTIVLENFRFQAQPGRSALTFQGDTPMLMSVGNRRNNQIRGWNDINDSHAVQASGNLHIGGYANLTVDFREPSADIFRHGSDAIHANGTLSITLDATFTARGGHGGNGGNGPNGADHRAPRALSGAVAIAGGDGKPGNDGGNGGAGLHANLIRFANQTEIVAIGGNAGNGGNGGDGGSGQNGFHGVGRRWFGDDSGWWGPGQIIYGPGGIVGLNGDQGGAGGVGGNGGAGGNGGIGGNAIRQTIGSDSFNGRVHLTAGLGGNGGIGGNGGNGGDGGNGGEASLATLVGLDGGRSGDGGTGGTGGRNGNGGRNGSTGATGSNSQNFGGTSPNTSSAGGLGGRAGTPGAAGEVVLGWVPMVGGGRKGQSGETGVDRSNIQAGSFGVGTSFEVATESDLTDIFDIPVPDWISIRELWRRTRIGPDRLRITHMPNNLTYFAGAVITPQLLQQQGLRVDRIQDGNILPVNFNQIQFRFTNGDFITDRPVRADDFINDFGIDLHYQGLPGRIPLTVNRVVAYRLEIERMPDRFVFVPPSWNEQTMRYEGERFIPEGLRIRQYMNNSTFGASIEWDPFTQLPENVRHRIVNWDIYDDANFEGDYLRPLTRDLVSRDTEVIIEVGYICRIEGNRFIVTTSIAVPIAVNERPVVTLPSANIVSGSAVAYGTEVLLSGDSPNVVVRYTLNGALPTTSSPIFNESQSRFINANRTITTRAFYTETIVLCCEMDVCVCGRNWVQERVTPGLRTTFVYSLLDRIDVELQDGSTWLDDREGFAVDFGRIIVGENAPPIELTIQNAGSLSANNISVDVLNLDGMANDSFSVSAQNIGILQPNGTIPLTITAEATSPGLHLGFVAITGDNMEPIIFTSSIFADGDLTQIAQCDMFVTLIRNVTGISTGPIMGEDVAQITTLNLRNMGITSLAGIELFADLQELDVSGNALTALHLTQNLALRNVNASNNQLSTLDVSQNVLLEKLRIYNNVMSSPENVLGWDDLFDIAGQHNSDEPFRFWPQNALIGHAVTVNNGTGGGNFAAGASVTITANTPPAGQRFIRWNITPTVAFSNGTSATSATAQFTMPAQAVTATAVFDWINNNVTVINGTGSGSYNAGDMVTITANPPQGQRFLRWEVSPAITFTSGNATTATASFVMPAHAVTATAVFETIVTSVGIPGAALRSLIAGQSEQLTATVMPQNAANRAVTWSSSNNAIALVSTAGVVVAVAPGTVIITATTADGGHVAQVVFNVSAATVPVTGVTIAGAATRNLNVGATAQLSATVSPANATNRNVTWQSSNTAIATVNASGLVTARAAGTATITVTTADSNRTARVTINVTQPVTGVTIAGAATRNLNIGATAQLSATVSPANATNRNVTWSSSNTAIATVNANGLVTARAAGTATITVRTADGNRTAQTTIRVYNTIFSTRWEATFFNWLLFFLGFGWLWMWF